MRTFQLDGVQGLVGALSCRIESGPGGNHAEDATAGGKEVILVPGRSGVGEGDLVGTLERVESENFSTGDRVVGISLTG